MSRRQLHNNTPVVFAIVALLLVGSLAFLIGHSHGKVLKGSYQGHNLTVSSEVCSDPQVLKVIDFYTKLGAIDPGTAFKAGTDDGDPLCWTDLDETKIGVIAGNGQTGWVPRHVFNPSIPMPQEEGASPEGNI